MERMEESVEFEFRLRIARLALVPRDQAEVRGAALAIRAVLHKNPSNATHGGID